MKLNSIERAAMNNPLPAAHQHHREAAWFHRLAGGTLTGQHVLEVGCGSGVGVEVLLDRLHAARVTAVDLDPAMIDKARRRVHRQPSGAVSLSVGDACDIHKPAGSVDAVVEFGVIHHVPDWRSAIGEIAHPRHPAVPHLHRPSPPGPVRSRRVHRRPHPPRPTPDRPGRTAFRRTRLPRRRTPSRWPPAALTPRPAHANNAATSNLDRAHYPSRS